MGEATNNASKGAFSKNFGILKTLVVMQLKDKIDMSFTKTTRGIIFKVMASLLKFIVVTAAYFLFFYLTSLLKLFSFSGSIPSSLVTVMFALIFVLSAISCTVGLMQTLYMTADNKVLLTLPASGSTVFLSKFVMYYLFELKKNCTVLLPLYLAYGIVSGAVWYYYPWAVLCFLLITLLAVCIGAILSIPALFARTYLFSTKWVQAVAIFVIGSLIGLAIYQVINLMPENIDIAGKWGTISTNVQNALNGFSDKLGFINTISLTVIGGETAIRLHLFNGNTAIGIAIIVGTIVVCGVVTFLLARPLFFKMVASQFEFEKSSKRTGTNRIGKAQLAPLYYNSIRTLRFTHNVVQIVVDLFLLPLAVFLQCKTYAAMDTRFAGQFMTIGFTMLVMLLIILSNNVSYASVYSRDASARPIEKTFPSNPVVALSSRLVTRVITITLSCIASVALWRSVNGLKFGDALGLTLIPVFIGWAHLLWSAELDIMNPQHEQYATVGEEINNPNETKSTLICFILSLVVALLLYFLLAEGISKAIWKIAILSFVILVARIYLYVTRIKLYYAEK